MLHQNLEDMKKQFSENSDSELVVDWIPKCKKMDLNSNSLEEKSEEKNEEKKEEKDVENKKENKEAENLENNVSEAPKPDLDPSKLENDLPNNE